MPKISKRMQELYTKKETNQKEISMRERIVDYFTNAVNKAQVAVDKAQKWVNGTALACAINVFGFVGHQEWLEQTGQYLGLFETDLSKFFTVGMVLSGIATGISVWNLNKKEAKLDRAMYKEDMAIDRLNSAIEEGDNIQEDIVRTEKFEAITRWGDELAEQARQEEMLGITAGDNAQPDASVQIIKDVKPQTVVENNGVSFDPTN